MTPASGTDVLSGICIREIGDLSFTASEIDVTCHGSGMQRKFISGFVDLGTLPVTILYDDEDTSNALYTAFKASTSYTIVITIPTGASTSETLTFSAFIQEFGQTHAMDGVVTQTMTLRLDGNTEPTWA